MREILFRGKIEQTDFANIPDGWGEKNGDWVEGLYHAYRHCTCHGYEYCECDGFLQELIYVDGRDDYPIAPATVGQFTGLLDKTGKRIFEGDIVRVKYYTLPVPEYIDCEVDWQQDSVGFTLLAIQSEHFGKPISFEEDIQVIGNIHDNPELSEDRQ
jgi:uncharacterized phage protein (TIGR01671 family)